MFFDDYEYEKTPQKKTAEYRALIAKIDAEIAEKELMKESLTDSMIRSVKSISTPFSMLKDVLPAAMKQQHEKLKKDRGTYELVKDKIIELFFHGDKDAKLTDITSEGWESYAYWFYVDYKNTTFILKIPDVRVAKPKFLENMNYGMYSVSYQKSSSWSERLACSYKEEDIANAIDEFIKQRAIGEMDAKKAGNILNAGLETSDDYER